MTAPPPDGPPAEPGFGPVSGQPSVPAPASDAPFDPYRFGPPAHPIDPAYAPPGYVPAPPLTPPPTYPTHATPGQQFPAHPSQPGGYPPVGYDPNGYLAGGSYPPSPQYGPAPYGQAPYGYAAPPGQYANRSNGLATTALVLGIIALVFSWVPFLDALIFIPAVVFGIVGINAAKKRGGVGRTIAIVGLCLAVAASVICVAFSVYVAKNIHCSTVNDGFGNSQSHCALNNN